MKKIKQSIIKDYQDKMGLYKDFASSVKDILKILLKDNGFFFQNISPRAKTIDSLKDKLCRLDLRKFKINKFSDIQDLAGVRIIFYLESDAKRFVDHIYREFGRKNILEHEWKIDEEGYNAIHLVIKLNEDRERLSEYSRFEGLQCEIQITTVLFHAWSEMSHKLIYKPKHELLDFDKRSFEVLDKHFKDVVHLIREASLEFEAVYHKFNEIQKGRSVFDIDFLRNISREDSNNKIYRQLELLEKYTAKFGDKLPKGMNIIQLVTQVIEKSKINRIEDEKTVFGYMPGKIYPDITTKCLEILDHVKYTEIPGVFNLLVELWHDPDNKINNKVREVLGSLAKYNLYVLRHEKIGYALQRIVLNAILEWNQQEKIENIEAIKIIARELLQPSFEGTTSDWDKSTISFGPLEPTPYLRKIRRDTISLLIYLYDQIRDLKARIGLLEILEQASFFPDRGKYGNKVVTMITDDVKHLANVYERMVFGKQNRLIVDAPIVQEVDRQLIWFNKNHMDRIPKITGLLDRIERDEFYDLYRALVGDTLRLARTGKRSWQEAEEERNKKIDSELQKIGKLSVGKWTEKLNSIAKYKDVVDEWKFQVFENFLTRIAQEKSDLAEMILADTLKNNSPLATFIGAFLLGFRQANNLTAWDKYVKKAIIRRNTSLIRDVSNSFFGCKDLRSVREEDIELLSQIIRKEKPFDFLRKARKNVLLNLNFSLIRILVKIYQGHKNQIETLIRTLIERDKNNEYLDMYVNRLGFAAYGKEMDLSEWSDENIKFILGKLVELRNLNDEAQLLLLAIAENNFPSALEIFIGRIRRDKMTQRIWISSSRYVAIPYHFNNELRKYISNNHQYPKIAEKWIKQMTKTRSSTYNIELARFLQGVDGSVFRDILLEVIGKGGRGNLDKAVALFWGSASADFDICFQIIKKTDDTGIWNDVRGLMRKTGVVAGEYGIAEAYRRKMEKIKEYRVEGNEKEKERAEKFRNTMIKNLSESVKRERRSAEEETKLGRIEFE